jgi:hypothetical protein
MIKCLYGFILSKASLHYVTSELRTYLPVPSFGYGHHQYCRHLRTNFHNSLYEYHAYLRQVELIDHLEYRVVNTTHTYTESLFQCFCWTPRLSSLHLIKTKRACWQSCVGETKMDWPARVARVRQRNNDDLM